MCGRRAGFRRILIGMRRLGPVWLLAGVCLGACIATAPEGIQRQTGNTGGGGEGFGNANQSSSSGVTTGPDTSDPHAVLGTDPPHGPFTGGQRVIIVGKGFEPDVQVWFGDAPAEDVIAIDPTRIQVTAPPGAPGEVDVSAQNGDDDSTRRALPSGYSYDALYASPDNGPVAGGTVINIFGTGTTWDEDIEEARVDQKPCTTLQVVSATELICTVPQGTPGTKSISVKTANETLTALDAYSYQDSDDGFKGGLGGDPIAGTLRVLAYDNFSGDPIPGAHVVIGSNSELYQQTDSTGVVELSDPFLDNPAMVTVTAECHSPITFAEVPVDTVTVYLNPVITPQCAGDGDPPPGGGNPVLGGVIAGELVWPSAQEFQKGPWSNVPTPGAGEQRIAYLYFATSNRNSAFQIPPISFSVDEDDPGDLGYGFSISSTPGNRTLYALAGIRKTSTNQFTAYAFGAVDGVGVFPGAQTSQVFLDMDNALDQALTMNVTPPAPGPKGPDRLDARVVVEMAQRRYAILPGMQKMPFIPLQSDLNFIGLPGLDGPLTGMRYIASAAAVTGPNSAAPMSVVNAIATTTTSVPADVTGFVSIPTLTDPPSGGAWNGRNLATSFSAGGFPVDMSVYELSAGGGLWRWVVAVPQGDHAIVLPDLSGFADAHLPNGPVVIGVFGARIEDYDYGTIGYRNLRPIGMDAYSLDFFNALL
jgi:IPT/TIG domain